MDQSVHETLTEKVWS